MRKLFVGAAVLPLAALTAVSATAPEITEEAAVRAVVEHYFDGMMQGSPEHLAMAFHRDARLIGVGEGSEPMIIPFERWAGSFAGRAPLDPARHRNTIVSIDIHKDAASVKTDLVWPDVRYIDYLSLLKLDGEWKIVNKIWSAEQP